MGLTMLFLLAAAQDAVSSGNFLIDLLKYGGLPALTIGVMFIIGFWWVKANAKQVAQREAATAKAFQELQKERLVARNQDYEQNKELMKAYEEIVEQFITLTRETTQAITRLSERVGQCPFRNTITHASVTEDPEDE